MIVTRVSFVYKNLRVWKPEVKLVIRRNFCFSFLCLESIRFLYNQIRGVKEDLYVVVNSGL